MLSTTRAASPLMAATAAMSVMLSAGLVGVSSQISLVFSRTAPATASTSVVSTTVYSTPHGPKAWSMRRQVPP